MSKNKEEYKKITKSELEKALEKGPLKPDINPELIRRYSGNISIEDSYFAMYGTYRLPSGASIFTAEGKKEWEGE